MEGGVWVGIDRYDNDGVPSDAEYTVLPSSTVCAFLQYQGPGGTPWRCVRVLLLGTIRIIQY